jgi:cellulose synthase/poly-beta-1,6-N-acetylglucosamine synthase-like glycosyltransferase
LSNNQKELAWLLDCTSAVDKLILTRDGMGGIGFPMNWANGINYLYVTLVIVLSIYGLHALVIASLFLLKFRQKNEPAEEPKEWPVVAVQLPMFNEQTAAEHIIDTVCAFDYPIDCLYIQVLDDSTDQTTELVRQKVEHYQGLGFNIELLHRTERMGYKAGALVEAMNKIQAEFIAIFDADFVPPPNFLRQVLPYFSNDPRIGMVQTRWGYLNRNDNLLTQTQALFLDGHQVVEQVARSRSGLLLNFNGSGGIWRSECIRDSGGWQWDTLSEDIDISYRAQLKKWRLVFLPNLIVPTEVPKTIITFKKQQYRWTFGHIQVFRKLIPTIWTAPGLNILQRIGATFHLSTNFIQLAALTTFLLSVPLALLHPKQPSSLGLISLASSGPTILFAISQIFGYKDGFKNMANRLLHLPVLVLLAIGLTISNSWAVLGVFLGRKMVWSVTPKRSLNKNSGNSGHTVPVIVWLEIALSIYCAIGLSLALQHAPELIPLTTLGMLSFGYVGYSSLVESNKPKKTSKVAVDKVELA